MRLMMYYRNAFYILKKPANWWHSKDTPQRCECGAFWIVRGN